MASGSVFGVIMNTDNFTTGIGTPVIVATPNQFGYNGSITPDEMGSMGSPSDIGFIGSSLDIGSMQSSSDIDSLGSSLDAGVMESSIQNANFRSSLNVGYNRSPSSSGSEKSSNYDEKFIGYNTNDLENDDLGAFAINFCNNFAILEENLRKSQSVNTPCTFGHTGDVDSRVQSTTEYDPKKNAEKIAKTRELKKLYVRHKKGPKQITKDEIDGDDEERWKNVQRCREYRVKKKSTVAEEKQRIKELEEENHLLKAEEDERRERVSKMKAMYFQLIYEGKITMN